MFCLDGSSTAPRRLRPLPSLYTVFKRRSHLNVIPYFFPSFLPSVCHTRDETLSEIKLLEARHSSHQAPLGNRAMSVEVVIGTKHVHIKVLQIGL